MAMSTMMHDAAFISVCRDSGWWQDKLGKASDEVTSLEDTSDSRDATNGERICGVWVKVSILFLASSLLFIDTDMSLAPNVNDGSIRIDNGIPSLCYASLVPSAKGCVEFQ